MNKKWVITILIILIVTIGFASVGLFMSNVEQPKYEVIESQGNIEIRQYQPMIIAEIAIEDNRKEAIKSGFKILASYIFGNNKSKKNVSMTAPVRQQSNEKISMTAPVSQQKVQGAWRISFVMPSQYSIDTIPVPNNEGISIKKIDSKKYAVLKFSGMNSDKNINFHEIKLKKYLSENKIQAISSSIYAFYNPPWTLPFLRRNEIMIEVN